MEGIRNQRKDDLEKDNSVFIVGLYNKDSYIPVANFLPLICHLDVLRMRKPRLWYHLVTAWSCGYGDVTVTYIRRSKKPSRIYTKHQYKKESEYGSTWYIIHSNIWVQLQSYHQMWLNIIRILHQR